MSLYLDTNVFYHAYCPIEDQERADWLLKQLTKEFQGVTCEWAIIEMFRALKKQANLGTIEEKDAKLVIEFFLSEIGEMCLRKRIILVPVTQAALMAAKKQIFENNLYAADALHTVIAIQSNVLNFITFDSDFKGNLGTIPILSPNLESFKENILQLKNKITND